MTTEHDALRSQLAAQVVELEREVARLREALTYYAEDEHYDHGDVPGHIYVLDDHGRAARAALACSTCGSTTEGGCRGVEIAEAAKEEPA